MSYQINLGQWNSVFAVPSALVDKHIKLASESQLRVILYLLRHSGDSIEKETLSRALGIAEQEVENALDFWKERGLIAESGGELTPPAPLPADNPAQPTTEKQKPEKHTSVSRAVKPDSAFVAKVMQEDKSLVGLLDEAQSVLGKPLSPGDTATLVMLYSTFGLPCEVLALLINYIASTSSPSIRAVERLGISWSDNGIVTVDAAEAEIERLTASREAWQSVSKLMGVHNIGKPTKAQQDYAYCWTVTWGFNDEMIVEAYERCVNTKGEYNIKYINAILKRWYEKRIFSLDELKKSESAPQKASKTKPSSKGSVFSADGASFDLKKYENQSIFDD